MRCGNRSSTPTPRSRPDTPPPSCCPSLLDLLGENDPYLRDEVGYGVLARWVVQDQLLGADELRYAVERLVPDLRLGLDGDDGDDQAAVRRSYSALALAILAYRDVEDHFLDADRGPRACSTPAIDYLLDEPDRRGYVPELGWINATAHAADLLKFLVRNPRTDRRRPPAGARRAAGRC